MIPPYRQESLASPNLQGRREALRSLSLGCKK